jgi:hypothetical protein
LPNPGISARIGNSRPTGDHPLAITVALGGGADVRLVEQFRRLRVRYDKRADIHEAFLSLACVMICWQNLPKTWVIS